MSEDVVTVSYQNGHYEVYDHTTNTTWVRVMFPNGNSRDMDTLDVCSAVERIMNEYDAKRVGESEE